ncbi:MAG: acyloxyacyl hydrolase [Chlamydiales bacterium]
MRSLCGLLALSMLLLLPVGAAEKKIKNHVMVGGGVFNIVRPERKAQFQIEYRWNLNLYNLRPLLSLMGTEKGTLYICGGLAWDIFLGKQFVLTPSFAPGLYSKGSGKSLHYPLEFRSAIELAYVFKDQARIGAQFYHISNASLARKNPGAESLILFYSFPLRK